MLRQQLLGLGDQPGHDLLDVTLGHTAVHRVGQVEHVVGLELAAEPTTSVDDDFGGPLAVAVATHQTATASQNSSMTPLISTKNCLSCVRASSSRCCCSGTLVLSIWMAEAAKSGSNPPAGRRDRFVGLYVGLQ
jgi:hypothetical protein